MGRLPPRPGGGSTITSPSGRTKHLPPATPPPPVPPNAAPFGRMGGRGLPSLPPTPVNGAPLPTGGSAILPGGRGPPPMPPRQAQPGITRSATTGLLVHSASVNTGGSVSGGFASTPQQSQAMFGGAAGGAMGAGELQELGELLGGVPTPPGSNGGSMDESPSSSTTASPTGSLSSAASRKRPPPPPPRGISPLASSASAMSPPSLSSPRHSARSPLSASAESITELTPDAESGASQSPSELLSSSASAIGVPVGPGHKLDDDPHRANIVQEILSTEKAYVSQISLLIKNYKGPLNTLAMTNSDLVKQEDIKVMFSNIHLILPLNQTMLKDLQARIDTWSPKQKLGDVFVQLGPFLKMYNEYGNNYKQALALYNHYVATCPKFVETINLCKLTCKPPMNLESLLITPVQRIPRYNLLLQDLIKNTDATHPDYDDLCKALALMKDVSQHINESVKKTDNLRKLAEASSKGAGFRGLMEAHRQLIRDGLLQTVDSRGHKEKMHFFLFNDILVFANKNDVKKQTDMTKLSSQWPLELVWLGKTTGTANKGEVVWELVGPNTSFTITCQPDEMTQWTTAIQKLLAERSLAPDYREGAYDFGVATYVGQWMTGKIHGQGRYCYFGNEYEGGFENGNKSGQGVLVFNTGDVYEGTWANDMQSGQGSLRYSCGSRYVGEWVNGKKQGLGEFVWASGDRYTGSWKEDLFSGAGKLTLSAGVSYDGSWQLGKFHGKGTLILPSGKTYMGEWVNGQKEGHGVLDTGHGERYEGVWKANKKHGLGTFVAPDSWGVRYIGNWALGKKEGQGTMFYMDNSKYEGQWKADVPHGKGTLTLSTGDIYAGAFKNGKPAGTGQYTHVTSSVIHQGKFAMGIKDGKCTITRLVSEQEKAEALKYPPMDKLVGTVVDGRVTCTNAAGDHTVEVIMPPPMPNLDMF